MAPIRKQMIITGAAVLAAVALHGCSEEDVPKGGPRTDCDVWETENECQEGDDCAWTNATCDGVQLTEDLCDEAEGFWNNVTFFEGECEPADDCAVVFDEANAVNVTETSAFANETFVVAIGNTVCEFIADGNFTDGQSVNIRTNDAACETFFDRYPEINFAQYDSYNSSWFTAEYAAQCTEDACDFTADNKNLSCDVAVDCSGADEFNPNNGTCTSDMCVVDADEVAEGCYEDEAFETPFEFNCTLTNHTTEECTANHGLNATLFCEFVEENCDDA
eukprot:gene585-1004_t